MFGFGAIGELVFGEMDGGDLTYNPVSRVVAGGFINGRQPEVAVLGVDLIWDDESLIVWDDDSEIGWE